MSRPTLIIDLDRCVGCCSCTVACQTAHAIPVQARRITVYQIGPYGTFPQLALHYLPVMCQHCQNPPCLEACPTGATRQNEDGLVWINKEECTGCGACVEACPFNARYVHPEHQIAEGCDHCQDRQLGDEQPFCARSCAADAIRLGEPDHPDPHTAQWLKSAGPDHHCIAPDPGAHTVYLLQRQPWAGWEKIQKIL